MVGLVARYGTKVVVVTAPSQAAAEEIALQLFAEAGLNLKGIEVPMVVFNPNEMGGLMIDPTDDDPFDSPGSLSMEDWGPEGYNPKS